MATKWVLADYFQLTDWWLEEFISYFTLAVRFVFCQHSREGGMVWSRHLWNHFSVLIVKKATNHKSLTLWDLISLSCKVDLFKTTLFKNTLFKTTFKTQRYAGFLLVDFNFVFSTSLLSSKTLYPFFSYHVFNHYTAYGAPKTHPWAHNSCISWWDLFASMWLRRAINPTVRSVSVNCPSPRK